MDTLQYSICYKIHNETWLKHIEVGIANPSIFIWGPSWQSLNVVKLVKAELILLSRSLLQGFPNTPRLKKETWAMNSLRIMGSKQIKAEHLVAMAVHMEWLATVLSLSNIFTLFMKYFISSIANAKYKSQGEALPPLQLEWRNGRVGVTLLLPLERLGVCSQDTLLLIPPSSFSSIRKSPGKKIYLPSLYTAR